MNKKKYELQESGIFKNIFIGEANSGRSLVLTDFIIEKIKEDYTVILFDKELAFSETFYTIKNSYPHSKFVMRINSFNSEGFELLSSYYNNSKESEKVIIIFGKISSSDLPEFQKALQLFSDRLNIYAFCQLPKDYFKTK